MTKLLKQSLAIMIAPPDEDGGMHEVWLMRLGDDGEPDFDQEPFVLAQARTYDDAFSYSTKLADMLDLNVLTVQND